LFDESFKAIRFHLHIASLSEHDKEEDMHGRLSMWRAFGGNTARVAIVFRIPRNPPGGINLQILFSPVGYFDDDEAFSVIREVTANIRSRCDFLRTLDRSI
jgi:hypothetical protein